MNKLALAWSAERAGREIDAIWEKRQAVERKRVDYDDTLRAKLVEAKANYAGSFKDFVEKHTHISLTTAKRTLRIADGRGEEVRQQERERQQKSRAAKGVTVTSSDPEPRLTEVALGEAQKLIDLATPKPELEPEPEPDTPAKQQVEQPAVSGIRGDYLPVADCGGDWFVFADMKFGPFDTEAEARRWADAQQKMPPLRIVESLKTENARLERENAALKRKPRKAALTSDAVPAKLKATRKRVERRKLAAELKQRADALGCTMKKRGRRYKIGHGSETILLPLDWVTGYLDGVEGKVAVQ